MPADLRQPGSPAPHHAEFLRLFLASERELLKYIGVFVPDLADAQEILQQTALVLWEKFDEYDATRPFTPWACRFALNVARQWADRRRRWAAVLDDNLAAQLLKRREELRQTFDARLRHLDKCVDKLPADHRRVLNAYYFERAGVEAIARDTRRTADAVYKLLQRIRRLLRDCVQQAVRLEEQTT